MKYRDIVAEAAALSILGADALNAATDAYLADLDTPPVKLSDAARYVEALILQAAYDRPMMSSNLGDVLLGAKAGKVSREALESAERTIADVSVALGVSAMRPWTPDMPEYHSGLKELTEHAVEEARRRVEDCVSRLSAARMGVKRRTATNTNTDKKRQYVPLRGARRSFGLTRCLAVPLGSGFSRKLGRSWQLWRLRWRRSRRWAALRGQRRTTRMRGAGSSTTCSPGACARRACRLTRPR